MVELVEHEDLKRDLYVVTNHELYTQRIENNCLLRRFIRSDHSFSFKTPLLVYLMSLKEIILENCEARFYDISRRLH